MVSALGSGVVSGQETDVPVLTHHHVLRRCNLPTPILSRYIRSYPALQRYWCCRSPRDSYCTGTTFSESRVLVLVQYRGPRRAGGSDLPAFP